MYVHCAQSYIHIMMKLLNYRSLHDALCVIRCLVKKRFLIAGGGAPETEVSRQLMLYANTLTGADAYCFKAFAEALEIIPYTLSENAGLNPIGTVTELRNRHAQVIFLYLLMIWVSNLW